MNLSLSKYVYGEGIRYPESCDLVLKDNKFYFCVSLCISCGQGHNNGVSNEFYLCTLDEAKENGWEYLHKQLCQSFSDLHLTKSDFWNELLDSDISIQLF